jgi:hypothetical protein
MSPTTSRGASLALGLLVVFAGLAGCAGLNPATGQQTDSQVQIEEVYVNNEDREAHAVDIIVEKNETVAYWKTIRVNGTDGNENGTRISHGETIDSEAFDDAPGRYVVLVRLDNRTTGERIDVNEVAGECGAASLQVEITDGGEIAVLRDASCS